MWVDLLGGGAAGAAAGILWTIPAHGRVPSSVNACVLRRLLLCGVVLWIDLRGGCAAAAACRSRPPNAAVSFCPDGNTRDSRRWGVMISRFPCTLAGTSTTAIEFCRNLTGPKNNFIKQKNTERMHTERSAQRE